MAPCKIRQLPHSWGRRNSPIAKSTARRPFSAWTQMSAERAESFHLRTKCKGMLLGIETSSFQSHCHCTWANNSSNLSLDTLLVKRKGWVWGSLFKLQTLWLLTTAPPPQSNYKLLGYMRQSAAACLEEESINECPKLSPQSEGLVPGKYSCITILCLSWFACCIFWFRM